MALEGAATVAFSRAHSLLPLDLNTASPGDADQGAAKAVKPSHHHLGIMSIKNTAEDPDFTKNLSVPLDTTCDGSARVDGVADGHARSLLSGYEGLFSPGVQLPYSMSPCVLPSALRAYTMAEALVFACDKIGKLR